MWGVGGLGRRRGRGCGFECGCGCGCWHWCGCMGVGGFVCFPLLASPEPESVKTLRVFCLKVLGSISGHFCGWPISHLPGLWPAWQWTQVQLSMQPQGILHLEA